MILRICSFLATLAWFTAFASDSPSFQVYAAYSLLAPGSSGETIIYARVILDPENECPLLKSSSQSIKMSRRSNPFNFSVAVCEAIIPFEQTFQISGSSFSIAVVKKNPARILVYGDTGCRSKDCSGPAKPFGTLATLGASLSPSPELILHMGDYNYRGTGGTLKIGSQSFKVYDAGDNFPADPNCQLTSPYYSQNATDSPNPDNWNNWWLDLFQPAQKLLQMAPLIAARGNHELCSRAGPGWFYFLGPGSDLPGAGVKYQSCPSQGRLLAHDNNVVSYLELVEPYTVNLDSLRVVVLDSSNACDGFAPEITKTIYQAQFEKINQEINSGSATWIVTHRPIWGLAKQKDGLNTVINQTLQSALTATRSKKLPTSVSLSLAGHMHRFETLTFSDGGIPQIIIGNSGVELIKADPQGNIAPLTIDGREAFGNAKAEFGFMDVTYQPNGSWTGKIVTETNSTLAICSSSNPPAKSVCELSN